MNIHSTQVSSRGFRGFRCLLQLTLVGVASAIAVFAQAGKSSITGSVSNAGTGAYLANAEIRISGTEQVAVSVDGGKFIFTDLAPGEYTLTATYTGLDPLKKTVVVTEGATLSVDFPLTSAQYDEVIKLGTFVVSTEREGNAKAIADQRQAPNIKNVIAADAFGSVAEDNVGEFLKYMPGLAINYNENDARTVSIRGMGSKYSAVTIDGNPVASADQAIGIGREFQFEQVSLSTIDSVEVNKTPLADQPAASLAGTVNVKSKSALNQKGRRIRYSASLTANQYGMTLGKTAGWDNQDHYKTLPNGSLEFSDTFMDGRLGIVASINHTGTYVEQKIIAGLGRTFDSNPTNNATEVPTITSVNWQDGLKPTFRDAILLNIDYKVNPDLIISLRTSYNMYDAPFHNRNWTLAAGTALSNLTDTSVTSAAPKPSDTTSTATVAGTNFRKYGATFSINPAVEWKINSILSLDASTSYSRSYQWYDSDAEGFFNIISLRMPGVSWGYSSASGSPALHVQQFGGALSNQASFLDINNYSNNATATIANRDAKDQFWTGKADFTANFADWRKPTVIKFGVDDRLQTKDIDTWTRTWSINVDPTTTNGIRLSDYPDPYTPDPEKGQTFTDLNGKVGAMPSVDKWRLLDLFKKGNTDPYAITKSSDQTFFVPYATAAANLRNRLQNMFDFKENIESAYTMANVKLSRQLTIVGGLRFERTQSEGRAYDDIGDKLAKAASGTSDTNNFNYILARYGQRSLKKQSYSDLFPSMQVRYAVQKNLILRGAYYRSILRPDPSNIARSLSITTNTDGEVTGITDTNPDLKPEYADNFEVRVERYFEPVGVVSLGLFYKRIKDGQMGLTSSFTMDNIPQDVLDLGYTADYLVNQRQATFTRTVNGPGTTLRGFELDYSQQLSFLPGLLRGFGVFANYTYTEPNDLTLFALAGNAGGAVSSGIPKNTANAGLSYKMNRFSGTVRVNWVGKRLLGATGYSLDTTTQTAVATTSANSGVFNWEKTRTQIDVNLEYQVSRRLSLFMNVANLTNSPSYRYFVRSPLISRHGEYGAKYTMGVKGSF
jgi:TonB-dependent receptor